MIAITFDVDDVAWNSGEDCDEFADAAPAIFDLLATFPDVKSSWFVRVDAGIRARRGRDDALLVANAGALRELRSAGHEVAWHHHAIEPGNGSVPSVRSSYVCAELRRLGARMIDFGMTSTRMGWAYSTNEIMAVLNELGFSVDSTALPRPSYPWDTVPRDWSGTSLLPYHPSRADYRVGGHPAYDILEVPVSVAPLPVENDTQDDVVRYLNLAYHPRLFRRALEHVRSQPFIVPITHPYETVRAAHAHHLLAFCAEALRENIQALRELERPFITMQELRQAYCAGDGHRFNEQATREMVSIQ